MADDIEVKSIKYYYGDAHPQSATAAMIYIGNSPTKPSKKVKAFREVYSNPVKEIIRTKEIIREKVVEKHYVTQKGDEMSLISISSILIIMVICIVTVKFVIPRLTWKYMVARFVGLVWKPARKQADEIKAEWKKANE